MGSSPAHSMVRSKGVNLTVGTGTFPSPGALPGKAGGRCQPSLGRCTAFPSRSARSGLERIPDLEVKSADIVNRPHALQVDAGLADQRLAVFSDKSELQD